MQPRPAALLTALLLAFAGSWVAQVPASAATVTDGQCSTDTGVTLVVDFQDLGGGMLVKCVEDVSEISALELLQYAGVTSEGTLHDGPSFVCRINGRPGPNETLAMDGDPQYRETCQDTSPDNAFWGYWHATNGGSWTFSGSGAGNREVTPGGYEGFSFSLNNRNGANPPPGLQPSHQVVQPTTEAPAPAPTPPTQAPAQPSAPPVPTPTAPKVDTVPPSPTASSRPSPTPSRAPSPTPTAPTVEPTTPAPSPTPPSTSPTPTPTQLSPTPSASVSMTETPASATHAPPTAPPVDAVVEDPGPPVGTLVGLGAVGALALAGGIIWWRRRGL